LQKYPEAIYKLKLNK